ncbi:hypothetical protein TNCV_503811 [Trichonephila clavipes]|nr:hypothetical protein TNCV_503811 [Trichonephila clavipes]
MYRRLTDKHFDINRTVNNGQGPSSRMVGGTDCSAVGLGSDSEEMDVSKCIVSVRLGGLMRDREFSHEVDGRRREERPLTTS